VDQPISPYLMRDSLPIDSISDNGPLRLTSMRDGIKGSRLLFDIKQ